MPPQHAERVRGIPAEHIEMLTRRSPQQVGGGAHPQAAQIARASGGVPPLVLKVGGHFVAEIAAEL